MKSIFVKPLQRGSTTMSEIGTVIGKLTADADKGDYIGGMSDDSIRSLGGKYWKSLDYSQKRSYLETTQVMVRDDPSSDHHIGDANFQDKILGNADRYINMVGAYFTEYYSKGEVFDFPEGLKDRLYTSKSAYLFSKLLQNTESYISRQKERAVLDTEGKFVEWKAMPIHPSAKAIVFAHYDQMFEGLMLVAALPLDEQEELLLSQLAPNTNIGYPFTTKQTKKNFLKFWKKFLQRWLPDTWKKWKKSDYLLTVDIIFDAIREAEEKGYYGPFMLFGRTQGGKGETKHRSVFGSEILQKAIGASWGAAKSMVKDDGYVQFGGLPWVAWDEWDGMFTKIVNLLPDKDEHDKIIPITKEEALQKFGKYAEALPEGEDIYVDVIGEDFSGYDQTIIYEDVKWLEDHPKLGWIFRYIFNSLKYSDVWIGNNRIKDIFFKSGNPFTSEIGSANHLNFTFNAGEATGGIPLAGCYLSDDNLTWWYKPSVKGISDYAKELGYELREDATFQFSRDFIVKFLQVLCGYVLDPVIKSFVCDPMSRYYGLAHSEREFSGTFDKLDKIKGDVRDVYVITGDVEIDAFLSKLGSFASTGAVLVLQILEAVKDTDLGIRAILAISAMKEQDLEEIRPYRPDLSISFRPTWLAELNVLNLLQTQPMM